MALATTKDGKPIRGFVLPKRPQLVRWDVNPTQHAANVVSVNPDGSGTAYVFVAESNVQLLPVCEPLLATQAPGASAVVDLDGSGTVVAVRGSGIGLRGMWDNQQRDFGFIADAD